MVKVRRRIERYGFFLFFFGFFLLAIGVSQDVTILRNAGIVILLVIFIVIVGRSVRDVTRPRRRTPVVDPSSAPRSAESRAPRRPPVHDPDNY